ncbi:lipocalin family protein [Paracoccus sp. Z118]|uniref:lipocalin family protein n=1 Tax=Paracoccus sp. Z118 TaxID=2851017 RepID=UPI001C2C0641|nr:lipocalin family protein [Paracoccus sp. Z118]MBV0893265.1 lipocalin family protein [Paracoccus sp. Z118]
MKLPCAVSALMLAAAAALAQEAGTVSGTEIDPQAYTGVWYEIASVPAPFQAACEGGTTALYELIDTQTLRVLNRCDVAGGEVVGVEGTAEVVNGNLNTFDVQFPQSPDEARVNYVVVAVGEMEGDVYSWSAVRSPESGFAWILSRTLELDAGDRQAAEEALTAAGTDVSTLQDTAQPPQTYDPAQEQAAN